MKMNTTINNSCVYRFIYKTGYGWKWTQQKSHFTFKVYTHTNVISHRQNTWFKDKHEELKWTSPVRFVCLYLFFVVFLCVGFAVFLTNKPSCIFIDCCSLEIISILYCFIMKRNPMLYNVLKKYSKYVR